MELSFDDYFATDDKLIEKRNEMLEEIKKIHSCMLDNGETKSFISLDFLGLGRGLGTHDYIGQRIHQISSILRNLSFIDENLSILARNKTFLRFLMMCSNIRWGNLHHMGLDMLGNVSMELELQSEVMMDDGITSFLLNTISDGLESSDRAVIISCLEIIYKLCQKESNEDYMNRCLSKKIYEQIAMFLCLSDIMLLLYTLECLYALSALGERSSNMICQVRGSIDTLVSLVTVEAQSYGPDACILMRVVETLPGNASSVQSTSTTLTTLSNVTTTQEPTHDQSIVKGVPAQHQPTATPPPSINSPAPKVVKDSPQKLNPLYDSHTQQQMSLENEQFAQTWLRATFEPAPTLASKIEQTDMYKMYISGNSKLGRRGNVPSAQFPRCVRTVFGGTVGPNAIKIENTGNESSNLYYDGLKIRSKPLPIVFKGVTITPQGQKVESPKPTVVVQGTQKPTVIQQPSQTQNQPPSILASQLIGKQAVSCNQQIIPSQSQQPSSQTVIIKNVPIVQQPNSQPPMETNTSNTTQATVGATTNAGKQQSQVIQLQQTDATYNSSQFNQKSLIKSLLATKVNTRFDLFIKPAVVPSNFLFVYLFRMRSCTQVTNSVKPCADY